MEILLALLLIVGGLVLIIINIKPPLPKNTCPTCGAKLAEGVTMCDRCGTVINDDSTLQGDFITIYEYNQDRRKVSCAFCDAENDASAVFCCVCGNRVKG